MFWSWFFFFFFKQKRYFVREVAGETFIERELYFQWSVIHHSDLTTHIIYHQMHTIRHFRKFWIKKIFFTHGSNTLYSVFMIIQGKYANADILLQYLLVFIAISFSPNLILPVVKLYHLALYLWNTFWGISAIFFVNDHLIKHELKPLFCLKYYFNALLELHF